jgi:hypothetical protein
VKQYTYKVQINNPSKQLAFFTRLQMMVDGEEILPSFWSANYLTLSPGESMTISVEVPSRIIQGKQPEIRVSGWNVEEQILKVL